MINKRIASFLLTLFPVAAFAAPIPPSPSVNFHVATHYRVPLTVLHADLVAEATGKHPSHVAAQVNQDAAWAVAKLHSVPGIRWHIRSYQTDQAGPHPVRWTVQERLSAWSSTPKALLPLLGTLQSRLRLVGLHYAASSQAQRTAMQQAVVRGLRRYREVAKQDCAALGFAKVRLGQVFVDTTPAFLHPVPLMMAARAVPGPVVGHGGMATGRVVVGGNAYCQK